MTQEEYLEKWKKVAAWWLESYGKMPDLNAVLLLIGIRETEIVKNKYKKEEKMDMMHVAICKVLSYSGYYEFDRFDEDGWPHYDQVKELPTMDIFEQEQLLKEHVILYLEREEIIPS